MDWQAENLFYFLSSVAKKKPPKQSQEKEKYGTLHDYACHPCARGHANLLCIVPILVDAPAEAGTSFLGQFLGLVSPHKEASLTLC